MGIYERHKARHERLSRERESRRQEINATLRKNCCIPRVKGNSRNSGITVDGLNALCTSATTLMLMPFTKRRGGVIAVGIAATVFHFGVMDTGSRLKLAWFDVH